MVLLTQRDHATWVLYMGVWMVNFKKRLLLKQNLKDNQEAGKYGWGCRGKRISMSTGVNTGTTRKQATLKGYQKLKNSGVENEAKERRKVSHH